MKKAKETSEVKNDTESQSRPAKAHVRYLRISARKMRLVINEIRYKTPAQAFAVLFTLKQKAARMVEKLLTSAVANAKVLGLDESRLYISDIRADGGPVMKRFLERSMGRADRILKRSAHLSIELKEGIKSYRQEEPVEEVSEKDKKKKKKVAKAS